MSAKPTSVARWADVGGAIVVPPSGKQDIGWVPGEAPPAEYFNWIENLAYQWQKWLYDGNCAFAALSASTFSVSGASSFAAAGFSGLLTASAGITIPTGQALTLAGTTTLSVGGLATFSALATFNAGIATTSLTVSNNTTLGDSGADSLTVNAAATFAATAVFSGNSTFNAPIFANGNVTLGDASGDTLTVNATATFASPVALNGNTTLGAGKTLTITDGAAAVKGMSTTRTFLTRGSDWTIVSGSTVTSNSVGVTVAGSTVAYKSIDLLSSHETITTFTVYFNDNGNASNISSMRLRYLPSSGQSGAGLLNVTGLTFSQSGSTWVMSGTPSVTLQPSGGQVFFLEVTTGAGAAWLTSIQIGVNT